MSEHIRTTKTKLVIQGDYRDRQDIQFVRRAGRLTVKWSGHVKVESLEKQTCDLGHKHRVVKDKTWVWDFVDLDREDLAKLVEFLQEPLPAKRAKKRVGYAEVAG